MARRRWTTLDSRFFARRRRKYGTHLWPTSPSWPSALRHRRSCSTSSRLAAQASTRAISVSIPCSSSGPVNSAFLFSLLFTQKKHVYHTPHTTHHTPHTTHHTLHRHYTYGVCHTPTQQHFPIPPPSKSSCLVHHTRPWNHCRISILQPFRHHWSVLHGS